MSKKKKKKQLNNDDSEWFIIDDTEFDSEEYKQALANPKPRDEKLYEQWSNSEEVNEIFAKYGF